MTGHKTGSRSYIGRHARSAIGHSAAVKRLTSSSPFGSGLCIIPLLGRCLVQFNQPSFYIQKYGRNPISLSTCHTWILPTQTLACIVVVQRTLLSLSVRSAWPSASTYLLIDATLASVGRKRKCLKASRNTTNFVDRRLSTLSSAALCLYLIFF